MFRESDYVPPKLHPTYKDRKVPEMQKRSQVSHFDDVPERHLSHSHREADIPVPTTHDTLYNPDHPDADWSGLVPKDRLQRKHTSNHRCQVVGIVQEEDGIVTKPGFESDFKHRTVQSKQHSTSDLIGGISAGQDQYKTTAHRQQYQEGNTKDQLVLKQRIGSKKTLQPHYVPSFEQPPHRHLDQNIANQQSSQQSNQDYKFTAVGVGGKNFISNLGKSLVDRVPDMPTSTPIDPNAHTKTLLTQNHKPHPGYTGHKKW